ncbi:MAG: tetratricopeptide repeat protein [Parachlamydiaceae bacterium]
MNTFIQPSLKRPATDNLDPPEAKKAKIDESIKKIKVLIRKTETKVSVDMNAIDAIVQSSFLDLLEERREKNLPYLLALVQEKNSIELSPFDGCSITQWVEKSPTSPTTRQKIISIFYFTITAREAPFQFLTQVTKYKKGDSLITPFFSHLISAYEQHAEDQYQIGLSFKEGIEIKQNLDYAKAFFACAAENKHIFAICELFLLNLDMEELENAYVENRLQQLIDQIVTEDNKAVIYMTKLFWKKMEAGFNRKLAVYAEPFFRFAASRGCSSCNYYVAACLLANSESEETVQAAIDSLDKSEEKDSFANYLYAYSLLLKKDFKKAFSSLFKCKEYRSPEIDRWVTHLKANADHVSKITFLAMCYLYGVGAEVNLEEAVRLYKLAVDQGDASAQYALARCHEEGLGIPVNLEEAVRLYRLAADQGDAAAQYVLALLHEEGRDTPVNLEEAVRLYTLAANQGHVGAQFALALCHEYGRGTPVNLEEAVRLYTLVADQRDAAAQAYLARCYEDVVDPVIADSNLFVRM